MKCLKLWPLVNTELFKLTEIQLTLTPCQGHDMCLCSQKQSEVAAHCWVYLLPAGAEGNKYDTVYYNM